MQNNPQIQQPTPYCNRCCRQKICYSASTRTQSVPSSKMLALTSKAISNNSVITMQCAKKNNSRTYRIEVLQQPSLRGDSELWSLFLRSRTLHNFHRYLSLWQVFFLLITMIKFGSNCALLSEPVSSKSGEAELPKSIMYNTTNVQRNAVRTTTVPLSNIAAIALSNTASISNDGSSGGVGYLDQLDDLERSVAAVLIRVAYGTTLTTKRSILENSYIPSLTTIATPLLTTLRHLDSSPHQQVLNQHHRYYELDLERDHALPTSAPNADILKTNSNPTYPNPNRHHSHNRDRLGHFLNSTPLPSLPDLMKKSFEQIPAVTMFPLADTGDLALYSPPARTFFTPPLPPEYQNPFHDKPILRGTYNEVIMSNTGTYINRRPIPPPSLLPGHERIPFRPPDIAASTGIANWPHSAAVGNDGLAEVGDSSAAYSNPILSIGVSDNYTKSVDSQRKKPLNTPSRNEVTYSPQSIKHKAQSSQKEQYNAATERHQQNTHNTPQAVLPSLRRILSGSNGSKGEIPEVLLKHVTSRPLVTNNQPPSSPMVLIDGSIALREQTESSSGTDVDSGGNINKNKNGGFSENYADWQPKATKMSTQDGESNGGAENVNGDNWFNLTPPVRVTSTTASIRSPTATPTNPNEKNYLATNSTSNSVSSSSPSSHAASAAANTTWTIAWYTHVYLPVVLFTILAVYSLYKLVIYNKLTHLFSQSYFMIIHLVLIFICGVRIFYLCYDAYNIHTSFHIFMSELLLNLPGVFLTVSFSILILFLFRKSLNHKNNRYSTLIRPLSVVFGCGVHVILCITLHYVESCTLQQQQKLYWQQQQKLLLRRQHVLQQQPAQSQWSSGSVVASSFNLITLSSSLVPSPPRVLSLICQIIYIFICFSLGLIYLYLYRILKRILRSKSQNYIHGYQNLSYAIRTTIATALLFVLLAVLQIFGAVSISSKIQFRDQGSIEIDWLQFGYQFSMRLIEIAIIALISWVAGLKTSIDCGSGGVGGDNVTGRSSGGGHIENNGSLAGGGSAIDPNFSSSIVRIAGGTRKTAHYQCDNHNHGTSNSHVAALFLPCTSSSSQEQFFTDYPAVCQATNKLHTYSGTGQLIYDDSFALNSLTSACGAGVRNAEYLQQPTYQKPYDTGSLHSGLTANHCIDVNEYAAAHNGGGVYRHYLHSYGAYLTDATTDHYESPNSDLRGSTSASGSGSGSRASGTDVLAHANSSTIVQTFHKTSTASTTASSSGGSFFGGPQQQQILLQKSNTGSGSSAVPDICYLEPMHSPPPFASNYDFNNFDRPKFVDGLSEASYQYKLQLQKEHTSSSLESCSEVTAGQPLMPAVNSSSRAQKTHQKATGNTSESASYELHSSNSTPSYAFGNSNVGRYDYNSFERRRVASPRKSGTFNSVIGLASVNGIGSGIETKMLTTSDHCNHHQQQSQRQQPRRSATSWQHGSAASSGGVAPSAPLTYGVLGHASAERNKHYILHQNPEQTVADHFSDDEDDDDRSKLAATSSQTQQCLKHPLEIIN